MDSITYTWTGAPSAYYAYRGQFLVGLVRRERGSSIRWTGLALSASGALVRDAAGERVAVTASSRAGAVTALLAAHRAEVRA